MQVVRADPSWTVGKHALMNVRAVQRNGRTELDPHGWRIPYQWQGAHYQDNDDQPFLLLINSGGGFVEGDVAELHATLEQGTRALITTTAASKFYKCLEGMTSAELVDLEVGSGALLEYYPDESIPFARSKVERRTRIRLTDDAALFATDMISAGRIHYAGGEAFAFDSLVSEFAVEIDGETILMDRVLATTPEEIEALASLWDGATHLATVVARGDLPTDVEAIVEETLSTHGLRSFGATRLDDLFVCRLLADEAWLCHEAIQSVWEVVRPFIAGKLARPIRKC